MLKKGMNNSCPGRVEQNGDGKSAGFHYAKHYDA